MARLLESIRRIPGARLVPVLLVLAGAAFPIDGTAQIVDEEMIEWVRENAVQIDYDSWRDVEAEDLSFLDEAIEGKRFVYLGVSDHWVHQKYDYRLMLIRYLYSRGFRHIGMEMDYSDGERIDRYLATGDEAYLQRVALYGYKGGERTDRDDSLQGFPGMRNLAFRKAFLSEERSFLARLRELNETLETGQSRLRWFGFDVGLFPCVGYEEIEVALAPHSLDPLIAEILDLLERVTGETRIEEAERLERLAEFLDDKAQKVARILGDATDRWLIRTVRHLADAYRFCEAAQEGPRSMKWLQGLIDREADMAQLMDELLLELPADAKVILMGHNLHLSKKSEEITLGPVGTPAPALWRSIGTHLAERFPGEIFSIWMLYDHGRHGTILSPEGVEEIESNPAAVEHLLARAGSKYMLLLTPEGRTGPLHLEKCNFLQNGSIASGLLPAQADAIFFVREVNELVEQ